MKLQISHILSEAQFIQNLNLLHAGQIEILRLPLDFSFEGLRKSLKYIQYF